MRDDLLADLTDEQRDAVTTQASPLCIIAGAGSGKTRVLTRRIAWQAEQGHIDPRRALAVTFTRRAAGELRARLRRTGLRDAVAAGTFHATALAQLRRHWDERGQRPRRILESRPAFLARRFPGLDRLGTTELATEIGWARARLITPDAYAEAAGTAGRRPSLGASRVARLYGDYEEAKRRRRLIDFDDVLALCHETVKRDPEFGAAQHWRHRHLFVDEFQDVNPLQFALLRAWIGDESTVLVVGDPDQAIYGWNGADPEFIRDVSHHLPGCAVLHLMTNFRSTPEILGAAGRVMERDPQPAVRASGSSPTLTSIDGDDEATTIARSVRGRHVPGSVWRRQAVLARTNAQLPPIAKALESSGIPVVVRGRSDLLRRPEIVELLEPHDAGVSLSTLVTDTHLEELDLDAERESSVRTLLDLARDQLGLDPESTVGSFLTTLRSGDRFGEAADGVELATFHAAKGLEWPIVHLIGLEQGLCPITHARSRESRAEERRLLHVAMTRAELELHVYWCRSRLVGDTVVEREPSPWLELIEPPADAIEPADTVDGLATARLRLASSEAVEPAPLRVALEDWRARVARQARIDPAAVVSDGVLDELAARRPVDVDDLAGVHGLAPGHARRWGEDLVAIVGAHPE